MSHSASKKASQQALTTKNFFNPATDSDAVLREVVDFSATFTSCPHGHISEAEVQTMTGLVEKAKAYAEGQRALLAKGEMPSMLRPDWVEEFKGFQRAIEEKRSVNGDADGKGEGQAQCGQCAAERAVDRLVVEKMVEKSVGPEEDSGEDEQALLAGGPTYTPHGRQVDQRYKAYQMLMKGFELDEATGFKRPAMKPGAEGFYNSHVLVPSSFTDIPHNILSKYLRDSHLQDPSLRLTLATSALDRNNLRRYLLQQAEMDDERANVLTKYFTKDEKTAKFSTMDLPGRVSKVEPLRLLQSPPLDFTNADDITVYLPCAVKEEQWDELKLVMYEADLCVLELYEFGINSEEGKHFKDAPTAQVVKAILQMPGQMWMCGQIYADRIMAASRLADITEFLDRPTEKNGKESESEVRKDGTVQVSHGQDLHEVERVETQDDTTAAAVPNAMEQELDSTLVERVREPAPLPLARPGKDTPVQDKREGGDMREEGDRPLAPREGVDAEGVKEQDVVTSTAEVIDEKQLQLRLERKVGKKLPIPLFPLDEGNKAASVEHPMVGTATPRKITASATTTGDAKYVTQPAPLDIAAVRASRDMLRRGYLEKPWEVVQEPDNADTDDTNKGDQSNPKDDFWPTLDSVCFDPLMAYEDMRLELCARRYKRALVAQQVRVLEECGHNGRSYVGETGSAAIDALDEKGRRRMRELEWRLRQDFPVVAEVVRWRIAWERDEIEL